MGTIHHPPYTEAPALEHLNHFLHKHPLANARKCPQACTLVWPLVRLCAPLGQSAQVCVCARAPLKRCRRHQPIQQANARHTNTKTHSHTHTHQNEKERTQPPEHKPTSSPIICARPLPELSLSLHKSSASVCASFVCRLCLSGPCVCYSSDDRSSSSCKCFVSCSRSRLRRCNVPVCVCLCGHYSAAQNYDDDDDPQQQQQKPAAPKW